MAPLASLRLSLLIRSGIVRRKFIGPVNWTSPEIVDYLQKL